MRGPSWTEIVNEAQQAAFEIANGEFAIHTDNEEVLRIAHLAVAARLLHSALVSQPDSNDEDAFDPWGDALLAMLERLSETSISELG